MFFSGAQLNDVFAHKVCDGSVRDKDVRRIFYLGACTQGKLDALHRKGLPSPIHTEVRVLFGCCQVHFSSPRGGWEGASGWYEGSRELFVVVMFLGLNDQHGNTVVIDVINDAVVSCDMP